MPNYELNVAFTDAQLETIKAAGMNVIVAKPAQGGTSPNVAWQVFRPLEANTVSWEEQYGIYASTAKVVNGATLSQLSSTGIPAAPDQLYTLQPSGVITGPASGGQPDSYALQNSYGTTPPYMTVGLYQDATVNGTAIANNAVSAVAVMQANTAVMTPYTTVYIWLQSQVVSNTVVTTVTSPMTQLKFGGGTNNISVAYNSTSGTFLPTSKGDAELVKWVMPCL